MSSESIELLYSIDENMNTSFAALLDAAAITAKKRGGSDLLATPYTAVDFVTGAAKDHWKLMADGTQRPDMWSAKLTVSVKVTRSNDSDEKLRKWKANLRVIFYDVMNSFSEANFPFYQITRIMEAGTNPTLIAGDDIEIASMEWDINFSIRKSAWPE